MIQPHYLYFLVDIVLSIVWLILFYFRKDLRKEMLEVSLFVGILTCAFAPFFIGSYWSPSTLFGTTFTIEDFLFGFFSAGICASIYEEICGRHFRKRNNRSKNWYILIIVLVAINLALFLLGVFAWGINPIYAHIFSLLFVAIVFISFRHDLLWDSLMSGIVFGALYFLIFILFLYVFPEGVRTWWHIDKLSGFFVYGIPIEEMLWAIAWGMCCGPFYEFCMGLRFKK